MQKLLMIGWVGAFVVAFLVYPILGFIRSTAVEAWVIVGKDANTVSVEKAIFEPPKGVPRDSKKYRDAVMTIYGVPTDAPIKVVFVPKEKFVRPEECPEMTLLPKAPNDDPMQLKTVEWMAPRTMLGASVVGFLLVIVWILLRKKSRAAAAPPAPPAA